MQQTPLLGIELEMFRPGVYLHYKGGLYIVTHLSTNKSQYLDGQVEISYRSLDPESHRPTDWYTREFREFFDRIHAADNTICTMYTNCHRPALPRFRFLGGRFKPKMLQAKVDDYIPLGYPFDGQD